MNPQDMLTGANVVLITLILTITGAIKAIFSDFFTTKLGQRILPVAPIILGIGLAFLGMGTQGTAPTFADKFTVGLMSGLSAAMGWKLTKSTVLGQGVEEKPKKLKKEKISE